MENESRANKFAKLQLKGLYWGFIICGIIATIMGSLFVVFLSLLSSPLFPFLMFPLPWAWFLLVAGISMIVIGVVLRHIFTKPKNIAQTALTGEEPTASYEASIPEENPSSFVFLPKKSFQRLGLGLVIYSIVGLILSYVLPWAMTAGGIFNHTLEDGNGFFGGRATTDILDAEVYYQDGIGIILAAYIIVLIVGILLIILGIIQANYRNTTRHLAVVSLLLSFFVFIIGIWSLLGTTRILSLHLLTIPQNTQFNFNNSFFGIFPAAYAALVFGLLYVKNGLRGIRIQQAILEPKPTPPKKTTTQQGG